MRSLFYFVVSVSRDPVVENRLGTLPSFRRLCDSSDDTCGALKVLGAIRTACAGCQAFGQNIAIHSAG